MEHLKEKTQFFTTWTFRWLKFVIKKQNMNFFLYLHNKVGLHIGHRCVNLDWIESFEFLN